MKIIADAIEAFVPPPPSTPPTAAQASKPALTLWLRTVSTDAYATDQQSLEVEVPGVPGLPAPPAIDDPNLATTGARWSLAERAWARAWVFAHSAAVTAGNQIRALPLNQSPTNMSAIWQCLAALVGAGKQDSGTRMILGSDLQDNRPDLGADYAGAKVLIDQSCPAGSEESCPPLVEHWIQKLGNEHAVAKSVRADAAKDAIQTFIETGDLP